ncbi:HNH endonuclease [Mycolicibacterium poriferae]|uniref:HNH endonuclease n=2 Tax=Mycolicibacterium poriferae TaxID=39694 RepID=A0A6N4V5C3_9MYCO|nr:HNH endonuclease [Mycolicibacterium poriferae]BBX49343.1 HNH endonuclease [Mycolicibacterium poriferae]
MFDDSLPGPAALADASDRELIDAIAGWSTTAAAAQARLLAALAERRRRAEATAEADPARARWACDPVDEAAAQIGCALTVSHGRALSLMDTAVILRDHLPRLNARFLAGQVSERVVARIVWLCALVVDDAVWTQLDDQFAAAATTWGTLSGDKLDTAITVWIHTLDPDAVRRAASAQRGRDFRITGRDHTAGTTTVWGRITSIDAAIAAARLKAMVTSVCPDDPRTTAQKRADAFGAVFAGAFHLNCLCGKPDCPAATVPDARATSVTVHVVADAASLDATPDPTLHGSGEEPAPDTEATAHSDPEPAADSDPDPTSEPAPGPAHTAQPPTANLQPVPPTAEHTAPEPQAAADPGTEQPSELAARPKPQPPSQPEPGVPEPPSPPDPSPPPGRTPAPAAPAPRPAVILGLRGAVLPPALLAEVLTHGATTRTVVDPRALPLHPGYRPTTAQDEFVRCRDLTCRVPGCDRPAIGTDLDHSNPWPAGPTHPSNLNDKCRLHHLLKTFWENWTEQQQPDGTLHLSTPTGHTYTTTPLSALLFPTWTTTTDPPTRPQPTRPAPPPSPGRALKMPRRQRTRAQNRAAYITAARQHNALQAELDRAAEEKAAEQRRARRNAIPHNPRDPEWHARQEAVDELRQSLNRPTGYDPNEPPPF